MILLLEKKPFEHCITYETCANSRQKLNYCNFTVSLGPRKKKRRKIAMLDIIEGLDKEAGRKKRPITRLEEDAMSFVDKTPATIFSRRFSTDMCQKALAEV